MRRFIVFSKKKNNKTKKMTETDFMKESVKSFIKYVKNNKSNKIKSNKIKPNKK
jgi:hypothetical protein